MSYYIPFENYITQFRGTDLREPVRKYIRALQDIANNHISPIPYYCSYLINPLIILSAQKEPLNQMSSFGKHMLSWTWYHHDREILERVWFGSEIGIPGKSLSLYNLMIKGLPHNQAVRYVLTPLINSMDKSIGKEIVRRFLCGDYEHSNRILDLENRAKIYQNKNLLGLLMSFVNDLPQNARFNIIAEYLYDTTKQYHTLFHAAQKLRDLKKFYVGLIGFMNNILRPFVWHKLFGIGNIVRKSLSEFQPIKIMTSPVLVGSGYDLLCRAFSITERLSGKIVSALPETLSRRFIGEVKIETRFSQLSIPLLEKYGFMCGAKLKVLMGNNTRYTGFINSFYQKLTPVDKALLYLYIYFTIYPHKPIPLLKLVPGGPSKYFSYCRDCGNCLVKFKGKTKYRCTDILLDLKHANENNILPNCMRCHGTNFAKINARYFHIHLLKPNHISLCQSCHVFSTVFFFIGDKAYCQNCRNTATESLFHRHCLCGEIGKQKFVYRYNNGIWGGRACELHLQDIPKKIEHIGCFSLRAGIKYKLLQTHV